MPSTTGSSSSSNSGAAPPLPLPEWSLLALLLAELRGRVAAGDTASRWVPYVAVLPQRPGTVLDWPAKEVRQGCTEPRPTVLRRPGQSDGAGALDRGAARASHCPRAIAGWAAPTERRT
jgi:hypothetical protein